METKSRIKWIIITVSLLLTIGAIVIINIVSSNVIYAVTSSVRYLTLGNVKSDYIKPEGAYEKSDLPYSGNFNNVFAVYIEGIENGLGDTVEENTIFNFSDLKIVSNIFVTKNPHNSSLSISHANFKLVKVEIEKEEIISEKTLTGSKECELFSGILKDGFYKFTYTIKGSSMNIASDAFANDVYSFNFEIDTELPKIEMRATNKIVESGNLVNKDVSVTVTDKNFCRLYYKSSKSSIFSYTTENSLLISATRDNNKKWEFYAIDWSGNRTETISVTIDSEAPMGSVYKENETVESGSYVSAKSIKYIATDATAGLASCYVKLPGMTDFVDYVSGTSFTEEGTYNFYAVDKINNRNETQTITLDRGKPTGFLRIGNDIKQDGGYSNESGVSFRAEDNISGIKNLYIKYPDSLNFELYTADTFIVVEGEIAFYAEDKAHNQSDIITIIMDRGKPVGVLYANGKEIPSGTVTHDIPAMYSATDSISGVAACYIKTAEDSDYIEYINETEITEHNDYYFYCVDNAGNVSEVSTLSVDKDFPRVRLYRNGSQISEFQALIPQTIDENFCFNIGDTIKIVLKDQSILHKSTCNYELNKNIVVTMDLPQYVEITTPSGQKLYVRIRVLKNKPLVTFNDQTLLTNETYYFNSTQNLSWLFDSQIRKDSKSYMTVVASGSQNWNEKLTYNIAQMPFALDTEEGTETTFDITIKDPINIASYRAIIDKKPPDAKIIADGQEIPNGSVTNKGVIVECTEQYLKTIVYTLNGGESKTYEIGTELTEEGQYFFEVFDDSWNKASLTFEIDKTPPKAQLIADKLLIENGASVNAASVMFTANDRNDVTFYLKKQGETEFIAFAAGTQFTEQLHYEFYAEDLAGNRTEVFSVTIDREIPEYTIYADGVILEKYLTINANYIEFRATDNFGTVRCFIKRPGETSYSEYSFGNYETIEGKYYFYCVDLANNRTDESYITLDRTVPVGTLLADSTKVVDGDFVNANILKYNATDNLGEVKYYVQEPGSATFVEFSANRTFTKEGKYSFYCSDEAKNRSQTVSVTLDRTAPEYSLYAGKVITESGTYQNASYVKFEASDSISGIADLYVLMPGDDVFTKYIHGTQLTAEGTYKFFAEDRSRNRSEKVTLTLDRTKPTGTLFGGVSTVENNGFTNAEYITYCGADNFKIKTLYLKKPNSKIFETFLEGTKFTDEGVYAIYCEDYANNRSDTLTVTFDKTKPINTLYAGNKVIASGTKTNAPFIKLTATDELSGVANIYVKAPGAQAFAEYVSGTQLTAEGYYEFYTVDKSNNRTDTVSVILDRTAPVCTLYAGSKVIENGGYTTASYVKFTATDALAGVTERYVKMPGDKDFIPYTEGTILSAEGEYIFYAVDGSNNRTINYTVTIDRVKPTGTLYAGTKTVNSGAITNAEYVTFVGKDNIALGGLYIKKPNANTFVEFVSGERFTAEGVYQFYAEDKAGSRSDTVTITLDKTKPTGKLSVTTEYANQPISYLATDDRSGIARCEFRIDSGEWRTYTSGTVIPVTAQNGRYTFRAYDYANNVSDETAVYFDTLQPIGKLYAGSDEISNGSFTNAANIHFTATDTTLDTCYVLLPNAKEYVIYKNGALYADVGTYKFYAVDRSGNRSDTYEITVDRTAPTGHLYGDENKIENGTYTTAGYVKFTATDACGIAGLFVKMPGSSTFVPYTEGTMLTVEGKFVFYAVDNGNNRSNDYIVINDRTAPNVTLYAGTKTTASGTITGAGYVTFTATDNFALDGLFVKAPSNSKFERFVEGAQFTAEGKYEFYAEDRAGLRSETVTITLDTSKPTGQIYAGETAIANNGYTNSKTVSFIASDCVSGVKRILVKLPSQADFAEYESGRKISVNGIIQWKVEDFAENVSDLYTVTLDTEKPSGEIVGENGSVGSGAILNDSYVIFTANDNVSGIDAAFVKLPGADKFTVYEKNTKIAAEGTTLFYVSDKAGNKSPEYSVTLDRTKPIGKISVDSGYTNKAFSFTATDDRAGIARCEYKTPGGDWTGYAAGTVIPNTAKNGFYRFRAYDAANNISETISVCLDTLNPIGKLYVNDMTQKRGGYTNLDRISFIAEDENLVVCYVKTPNASEWKVYTNGALYSAVGRYEFYAEDKAGNRSETHIIVIDRTPKQLTLNGVTNGSTNGNVAITWQNVEANQYAPIISVTVNGRIFENGKTLNTIYGAHYLVKSEDAAGNVWMTEFVSERINVKTTTVNKEWWEAHDSSGKYFGFETYENALAYATSRERKLIRTGEWTNPDAWDTGIMMDAADSGNAKPGKFFIYKKSGDASVEVAYFTEERLNAVIREYAESGIRHFYYFNGSPSATAEGNDLYKLNTDGVILADKIELSDKAHYYIDGELYEGSVYDTAGRHEVFVKDDYGNEKAYTFIIVRELPDFYLAVGDNDYVTADLAQIYYLKNSAKLKISDALDDFAMFYVKDSNGEVIAALSLGDEFQIAVSGRYVVQAVNHYGLTTELQVYISLDTPTISFAENAAKKQMTVTVKPSKDEYAKLQSITVYKSIDGGETWVVLTADDYGTQISTANLIYKFRTSGRYRVVVEDTFHTGFEAIELTDTFEQIAPIGTLKNVENGGHTNKDVSFTWTDEATAAVTWNGETSEYKSGTVLTAEGEYEIALKNYDGQSFTVSFTIDKTEPVYELIGAENGKTANLDAAVKWTDRDVTAMVTHHGKTEEYLSGTVLTEDGTYKITLTDKACNVTEVEFTIDKTVGFIVNTADGFLSNEDVTILAEEELTAVLKKDGEVLPYKFGDAITEEGNYEAVLSDRYNNVKTISFRIFKQFVVNTFSFESEQATATFNGEPCETLNFDQDGTYIVTVEQDGKTFRFTVTLDRSAPTLTLVGVNNGGETKSGVVLKDLSEEAKIEVYLNGELQSYKLGTNLTELGDYRVVVIDKAGNVSEYAFRILYSLNGGAIALIFIGIFLIVGIILGAVFGKKAVYRKKLKLKVKAEKKVDETTSENAETNVNRENYFEYPTETGEAATEETYEEEEDES